MRASRRLALSFGLSALLLAAPALAHDFWLEPSSYSPRVGDRVAVRLRAERGESQQEGREKFSRCAATLLEVGQAMDRRVPRALGCPLELRLLLHPADEDSEGALGLRVLFRGRPLSGALVVALQASQPMTVAELLLELSSKETAPGRRVRERSDSRGEVTLQLEEAGPWLIKVVHMEPTEGDPDVDWESWWSSLTLAVPSRRSSATTLADSAQ